MTTAVFDDCDRFDRQPGASAYQQIERWFVQVLGANELRPGDKLPPEADVARFFGVSRMTLRQALSGSCCSWAAGADTRPVRGHFHRRAGHRLRSDRSDRVHRAVASSRDQSQRSSTGGAHGAGRCAGRGGAGGGPRDSVHEIVRIRLARKRPLALEHSLFPAATFPDLLESRLTGSLYRLLATRYGQRPHNAVEYLEPASVTDSEAAYLDVGPVLR